MQENTNQYPVGFHFSIAFEGIEQGFFQEVSGISNEMDVEDIVIDEKTDFKYKFPKAKPYTNLVLKRGIFLKTSSLLTWCEEILDAGFSKLIQTKNITIHLVSQKGDILMKWQFVNAYPIKYSISDFISQENEVLIETLELAYTYFQK